MQVPAASGQMESTENDKEVNRSPFKMIQDKIKDKMSSKNKENGSKNEG